MESMKFSQRKGITPIMKSIQVDSIDEDLRNGLWSALVEFYWEKCDMPKDSFGILSQISGSKLETLFKDLWHNYFKRPRDTIPTYFYGDGGGLETLRNYFFRAEWYEVYDFIEFVSAYTLKGKKGERYKFVNACNHCLEQENSGYRFVDGKITDIISPEEIGEIETAIEQSDPYHGVKQHLQSAIELMGDRRNPDYRNSIKESISAVESLCKQVSGNEKATLGDTLKTLEKKGSIHPALKKAFSSLYGYSSDADGIRHPLMKESNLTSVDASFMLIACSAFINYVIARIAEDQAAK